ncbi:amidophosphoribosyltransferase [Halothermothrix orenii]|uniref:Amidophosphoribosyltransferase n=1 Tax=Halothermothrix orenii (strain H 168 / OCM 544 / DSM 9562) TaxID=373903 RepID=B8D0M1_HALOH|nr:amidophosphoribosyltransferase [Halothermothrix orenii]ACL70957.1 amidophosphoribosyltransferase [Halothermothrix orenii H 168]
MPYEIMSGKPREECGVFGIFSPDRNDAGSLIYLGLHSLQHRGQESAGIAVSQDKGINLYKRMGLVDNVFNKSIIETLSGWAGIGHVRYSTTGSSLAANSQPILINSIKGQVALAHNGNLVNGYELRIALEKKGSVFHSTLDTEVIAHLIARSQYNDIPSALLDSLKTIEGAYSLVVLTRDKLIGVRDPRGFRPLVMGKLGEGIVLASETCALNIIGAEYVRDIEPGEMVVIDENGVQSYSFNPEVEPRFCIFEYIYFARPDSSFNGNNVHLIRKDMGRQLAREAGDLLKKIDVVVPVPDSGISSAQGFAEESGLPFQYGLIKNRYVGRTFINPTQEMRNLKVRMKLNPIKNIIRGKNIALIDDSIVRGTTSRQIVNMLKEAGARDVHLFVSSPPVTHSCYYGLDTSNRQELIASRLNVKDIAREIGADSLTYLSIEGLLSTVERKEKGCCVACFSGDYPTRTGNGKLALEKNVPEIKSGQ